jgi:glutamate dehydrogenase
VTVGWVVAFFFFISLSCHLFSNLGIDDDYFRMESVDTICNHILALYGAKIESYTQKKDVLDFNLVKETDDFCVYIHSSEPGVSQLNGPNYENK